jgi:hypothetical protein
VLPGPFPSRSLVEPSWIDWQPFPDDALTFSPTVGHGIPVTAWPGLLISDEEPLESERPFHEVPSAALLGICASACAVWSNCADESLG